MKRFVKATLGVTLLEIMLVLAIAAMVIVMSIRYYQTAQSSNQANAFVSQIQAYVAAAENLSQNAGFSAGANTTNMQNVLPGGTNAWRLPWGGSGTYAPTNTGFTFTPTPTPSTTLCTLITSKIGTATNNKLSITSTCTSVTYDASQI